MLRPLTAMVLLGTALLTVALVGQGVADARELVPLPRPPRGTDLPAARAAGVHGVRASAPALERAMDAAEEVLVRLPAPWGHDAPMADPPGGELPAGRDRPGGRPGDAGATVPPWAHARPEWPVALAELPDPDEGDGDPTPLPPGSVKVSAAAVVPIGFSLGGRRSDPLSVAARRHGAGRPQQPAASKARPPQELQDQAERIERELHSTRKEIATLRLRQDSRDLPPQAQGSETLWRRIDKLDVQLRALSSEYHAIRKLVPYPPQLDLQPTEQLQLRAGSLRDALAVTERRLRETVQQPSPERIALILDRDSLRRQFSDIAEALWTKLEHIRTERDQLTLSDSSLEGSQRAAELDAEAGRLQAAVDDMRRTVAFPPRLNHMPFREQDSHAELLRGTIEANDRSLADLPAGSPQSLAVQKENRQLRKELADIQAAQRAGKPLRPMRLPPRGLAPQEPPQPDGKGSQSPSPVRSDTSSTQLAGDDAPGSAQMMPAGSVEGQELDAPVSGQLPTSDAGSRGTTLPDLPGERELVVAELHPELHPQAGGRDPGQLDELAPQRPADLPAAAIGEDGPRWGDPVAADEGSLPPGSFEG
jgi:hypothetical protein